jgi:deoxyribodipyrimidine photolyase-like uncharacterized protein
MNIKMISQEVIEKAIQAWRANPDKIQSAREGFVRQIIG